MPQGESIPQEPRNKIVTIRVTAAEKRAVLMVADLRGKTESDLLRERCRLSEVLEEYNRFKESHAAATAGEEATV